MNGLDNRATTKHARDLGFVNVSEVERRWTLSPWPEDEHERRIEELTLRDFSAFLAKAGVAIMSRHPLPSAREAQDPAAAAQSDLMENYGSEKFYLIV